MRFFAIRRIKTCDRPIDDSLRTLAGAIGLSELDRRLKTPYPQEVDEIFKEPAVFDALLLAPILDETDDHRRENTLRAAMISVHFLLNFLSNKFVER